MKHKLQNNHKFFESLMINLSYHVITSCTQKILLHHAYYLITITLRVVTLSNSSKQPYANVN